VKIIIESHRAGEPMLCIEAKGRYMARGQRARLQYEWIPDESVPENKVRETIDLQWNIGGAIERMVRTMGENRMEFVPGKETEASYVTPAGILPMQIRTEQICLQQREQEMCLRLRYVLVVSGEEEALTELRIVYNENNF